MLCRQVANPNARRYGVAVNWRGLVAGVMVVPAVMALVGCSRTVTGSAHRVVDSGDPSARGYGYTDDRCGLLHDSTVQEIVGADDLVRPYSGAVCQYVLSRQSTVVDITYSWFETGSIDRERRLAESNKAQITDIVLDAVRRSSPGAR